MNKKKISPKDPRSTAASRFEQLWRERFQKFGIKQEDDAGIAGWSSTGLAARQKHFSQHWEPGIAGSLWLDAGCGAGTYTRQLNREGMRTVGLDYSAPSLRKARHKSQMDILWAVADVNTMPLKSSAFDGALCFGVTQSLSDSAVVCRELFRVVRPGAQVWVDGLNSWCLPHVFAGIIRRLRQRPIHLRYEDPRRIVRLFKAGGMARVRLLWLPIFPARLAGLQWLLETRSSRWLLQKIALLGLFCSHSFVVTGVKKGQD